MEAAAVVIVTEVAAVALQDPTRFGTFEDEAEIDEGVMDGTKKPFGYVNVMVPPGGNDVAGVKVSVIGTDSFNAMRSATLIANATVDT